MTDLPVSATHLRWGLLSPQSFAGFIPVTNPKHDFGETVEGVPVQSQSWFGTLADRRMGAVLRETCATCQQDRDACAGHFGVIELRAWIVPPHLAPHLKKVLEQICLASDACAGVARSAAAKKQPCAKCGAPRPEFLGLSKTCLVVKFPDASERSERVLDWGSVARILRGKPVSVWKALRIPHERAHPAWCIWSRVPVLPLQARPYRVTDDGDAIPDVTTRAYRRIMICVEALERSRGGAAFSEQGALVGLHDAVGTLLVGEHRVGMPGERKHENAVVMRRIQQHKNRAVAMALAGGNRKRANKTEAQQSIAQRLAGKHGRVRGNLLRNRTDQCLRAVITGTVELDVDEVGIPQELARAVTKPLRVNASNLAEMRALVKESEDLDVDPAIPFELPGSVDVEARAAKARSYAPYEIKTRRFEGGRAAAMWVADEVPQHSRNSCGSLAKRVTVRGVDYLVNSHNRDALAAMLGEGDIVHRRLVDGDLVLLNRQPSLHPGSILAMRVRVLRCSSLKMRPELNENYNADFDGDEMNVFVPQSPEAEAEMLELCGVRQNLMKTRPGVPNVGLMQNALVGAFSLSDPGALVDLETMSDIASRGGLWGSDLLPPTHLFPLKKGDKKRTVLWSGPAALSAALPRDFNWCDPHDDDDSVLVKSGELLVGRLTKKHLGATTDGFVEHMYKFLGADAALAFLNRMQPMMSAWLAVRGFTTTRADMCARDSEPIQLLVKEALDKWETECVNVPPAHAEAFWISRAKDLLKECALLTTRTLEKENPQNGALLMLRSGSKGKTENLVQMSACLGLQTMKGSLLSVEPRWGRLTPYTPHSAAEKVGFVSTSFARGLSLSDALVHARPGRGGVVDTSLQTPQAGYIARSLKERLQNVVVHYDGSLRDTATKNIVQYVYGGLGLEIDALWKKGATVTPRPPTFAERLARRWGESGKKENGPWERPHEVEPGTPAGTQAALVASHDSVQFTMNTFKDVGQLSANANANPLSQILDVLQVPESHRNVRLSFEFASAKEAEEGAAGMRTRPLAFYTSRVRVFAREGVELKGWEARYAAAYSLPEMRGEAWVVEIVLAASRVRSLKELVEAARAVAPKYAILTHTNLTGYDDAPPTLRMHLPRSKCALPQQAHAVARHVLGKSSRLPFKTVDVENAKVVVTVDSRDAPRAIRWAHSREGVLSGRTKCDHIYTVFRVWGIRAARNAIVERMRECTGGDVAEVHIGLLADALVREGRPRTIRSAGVPPLLTSVAARAGYDQELKRFVAGATRGARDLIRDIPSARMTGARVPVGTGSNFGVLLREDLLPEPMEEEIEHEEEPEMTLTHGSWWAPSSAFVIDPTEPAVADAQFSPVAEHEPEFVPSTPAYEPPPPAVYTPSSPTYAPASPSTGEEYSPSSPTYVPWE